MKSKCNWRSVTRLESQHRGDYNNYHTNFNKFNRNTGTCPKRSIWDVKPKELENKLNKGEIAFLAKRLEEKKLQGKIIKFPITNEIISSTLFKDYC